MTVELLQRVGEAERNRRLRAMEELNRRRAARAEWRAAHAATAVPVVVQEPTRRGVRRHQPRPFPLEDLERLLPGRCGPERAALLGIQYRQLCRLRHTGLTADQADDLAVAAGYHPSEVWPEWWRMNG